MYFFNMADQGHGKRPLPSGLGALIEFTGGDDKGRKVPLAFTRTVLGRKFGDILVRDIKVSSSHVALELQGTAFRIVDLDSSNGTYLGKRKVKQAVLGEGDEVRIGLTSFQLQFDPEEAKRLLADRPQEIYSTGGGLAGLLDRELMQKVSGASSKETKEDQTEMGFEILFGPLRGKAFQFSQSRISIGRIQCDLSLKDPDASRKHALIEKLENGQIILRDLASRNGTFVNDQRITNRVLQKGDRIRMGKSTLLFKGVAGQ